MAYDYPISLKRNNLTLGKPHMWVRYGVWHASSAGAKATGKDPVSAFYAWEREERARAKQRKERESRPSRNTWWPKYNYSHRSK